MAPPGLRLALLCALISLSAAEAVDPASENNFPPQWQQAPRDLDSFGKKDNVTVIDPWKYLDRIGMCKILLINTHKYFALLKLNETDNVLWGLPLTLAWEFVTGRLADPSKSTTCGDKSGDLNCISPSSWGACVDYYLSVVPFLVAAKDGIFDNWQAETEILPPKESSDDFCSTYDTCFSLHPFLVDKWKMYFKILKETTPDSDAPATVDHLEHCMWEAHEASIEAALPICKNRLQFEPAPEADFYTSLSKGVHFVGGTNFASDYVTIKQFQENFPPRKLRVGDECPLIPDFTPTQNIACQTLKTLKTFYDITGGRLLQLWKTAMRSPEGRKVCKETLESMFAGKQYTLSNLLEKLGRIGVYISIRERSIL